MIVQKKLELTTRDREKLQKDLGRMENTLTGMKDQIKKTSTGEKSNKCDFKQTMIKMEQKIAQATHEIRKKETLFVKMQEQYRKATKESVIYRNGIEISAEGCETLQRITSGEGEEDLAYMLKTGYEECQKRLVEENGRLKECLELTQKEMTSMLNSVITALKKVLCEKKDCSEMKCVEPIQLKPIVFQMPLGHVLDLCFT